MKAVPVFAMMVLGLSSTGNASAASSDWFEMEGARIRLVIAGVADEKGRLKGALDIELKPGWKTYWRDPGDAGVPPMIDLSANPGFAGAEILFPAPQRHDEGDFQWAGYDHPVRLPVTFTLNGEQVSSPIEADVFIGICETICVPVQARLVVEPAIAPENQQDIQVVTAAFSTLPQDATPDFGVTVAQEAGGKILLEATLPDGAASAELFIAGDDGYAFSTPVKEEHGGKSFFSVEVSRPRDKPSGPGLHYTLVTESGAANGLLPYF